MEPIKYGKKNVTSWVERQIFFSIFFFQFWIFGVTLLRSIACRLCLKLYAQQDDSNLQTKRLSKT